MSRTKTYKVIITLSSNPDAPTFDELIRTEVKEWLKGVLEERIKSGIIKVDFPAVGDKIGAEK